VAEENVARVGIALDSAAFQDGVSRALRDIDRLLSGLKTLQNANRQISLAAGGGMFGSGSKSPVSNFARDINRNAIPALRDMERNAIRVGGAVRRSMAEIGRLSSAAEQAQIRQERAAITAQRRAMNTSSRRGRSARDEGLFGTVSSTPSFEDPRSNSGKIAARYVLRSLEELITSESENYPKIMQPRPRGGGGRTASRGSQETVQSVATKFAPGKIFNTSTNLEEGLPVTIIGPGGEKFVLSGNGRVMGLRQLSKAPQGRVPIVSAVEGFVTGNPSLFGGSTGVEETLKAVAKIAKAKQTPILTRELVSTMTQLGERESGKLGLGLNTRTAMSESEMAMAVSKLLQRPPTGLAKGTPGKILSGGGQAVQEFIGQVLEVLPPQVVRSRYQTSSGESNKQFQQLLEGVAMSSAYGNNPATEAMITKLLEGGKTGLPPAIQGALRRNLGPQLTLRGRIASGAIPAEMDPIYNNLPQAIELLASAGKSYGPKFTSEQIGTQQGMEPASPQALKLAQAMRKAGSAGLPAFFEAIAQYGKRAVSASAPTLGLDPSSFTADPEAALRIASSAATRLASHKGPKTEEVLSSIVEAAIKEFATPEVLQPAAKKAARGSAAKKVQKAVEEKVEQVAEVVAEAVVDPKATQMRRPESERFFKVNPRAIGTAQGSGRARAGGYVPYAEASEAQRGKYNMTLLGGYAELEKQYAEAQAEAEYMKENFASRPGAAPHASVQRAEALRTKLTELRGVMIERGLAQPTMAEQIAEIFTGPESSSAGLTPTRTSGGGSGGGGGGRRRTTSGSGGGGGGEEPKVPKWIENFQNAVTAAGFDPQSLQYLNSSFKFGNTAAAIEPGLHGQSRAALGALQQYAAVRQLSMVQMSRGLLGKGGANGFWQPGATGEEGGIALGGLGSRTAAPLLRTFIHEIAHGTFNALMSGGYKPQGKVEMFGPRGEALGPTSARSLLSPYGESTASGHVDPAFYRSQAMISKAGGALLPQLAFHRMVEEIMPQGHNTQGIGMGKFSQLLTPHLKEFASPEQAQGAEEFVKFSARMMEAASNFTQGSIGRGGALSIMSEGIQQLGASSKAFPSTFFLEATSVVGNALKGLEAGDPANLTKMSNALMNAAALSAGPGEFRPGIAVASKAAEEVASYLSNASIEEKAAIALGANPKLLGDTSFNPGNQNHIKAVNEAIAQIAATASETARGASVARFANGQRIETPYAATQGLLGPYAPGSLMAQTSPLQFPGGSFQQRMQWYASQTPGQRAVEGPIPGAYARATESRFLGISPSYQKSYIQSRNRLELEAGQKSSAQQQFVESANASARFSSVQSKLNLVVQDGSIQFGHLSRALTSTGDGFTVSTINALKFAAAIAVGQQITGSIVGAFEHLKGGIIGFNAMLEAASVGFNTLFKNAGRSIKEAEAETTKTIATLRDFANVTNFRFGDLETAALRMQAFGFEVDTAKAALKGQMPVLYEVKNVIAENATGTKQFAGALVNIGDAVAALGGEDDKLRRITYALGQMNSAGRVYQNDMMQLANAGIAGYDILAKALLQEIEASPTLKKANAAIYNKLMNPATAVEEVRRLAKTGRLFGPGAVQAILGGLEERYGGGMKAFSRTFVGALTTVADTSQSLVATSFNPLFSVVRDLTIQLADFLQTAEATTAATGFAKTISGIAEAIRSGLPSAISMVNKVVSAVTDTFGKLAGSAASGTSSLGGFFQNAIKGLSTIGDVLQNDVIRNFGATLVTAKLVLGFISSNPLLATITASTAALGFLATAVQTNQFGLGTAFDKISGPLQSSLSNIGNNLLPSISGSLTSAATVIGTAIASLLQAFAPLIQIILEIVNVVSGAMKPFSSILGIALALFVGKQILIDGVASAMARFAMFTDKAASSIDKMKMQWFAAKELQAFERFGQQTFTAQMVPPQYNKAGELTRQGEVISGPFGGPGQGLSSPLLYKIVNAQLAAEAAKSGFKYTNQNEGLIGAQKISAESMPIAGDQAITALAWLKGLKKSDESAYNQVIQGATPSERLQLEEAMNAGIRNVVGTLTAFKNSVMAIEGNFNRLKFVAAALAEKLGGISNLATGMGVLVSVIGSLTGSESLQQLGATLTTLGIAGSALTGVFNGLKLAFGMSSLAAAITMVITALGVWALNLAGTYPDKKKKLDEVEGIFRDYATNKGLDFNTPYNQLEDPALKWYRDNIKPDMGLLITEITPELQAFIDRIREINNQAASDRAAMNPRYRRQRNESQIEQYAIRGYTPEQIASFMGLDLTYVKNFFNKLVQDGGEAGQNITKILTAQLDASGEALKKAQDILEKATAAFERPLNRLMSRVQTLISELFADEKKKLEEAKNAALANIEVLYNGETIRLGVLQEQYDVLSAQKKEMEEMQRLEDLRTKASEAALGMFDAGTDPLERARAARDAARQLFSEGEQMRLDSMASTIESAKKSVPYTATSEDYDQRVKALEVDQQERQRVLTETIDDLMRKVKNGKLTAAEAKKMLYDAFSQTGLDLSVAAAQGYDFMDSFSSGFMGALEKNIDRTFKNLPKFITSALRVLKEDAAYKKAQDELANILNPTDDSARVSGSRVIAARDARLGEAKRILSALQLAENMPGQTQAQKDKLVQQMSQLAIYISKLEKTNISADQTYPQTDLTLIMENFTANTSGILKMLYALFGFQQTQSWWQSGVPLANRPGDLTPENYRASGGAVGAGTYMVGERGPEMLQMFPNGGGYVVPNHKLPSGMRSSAAALGGGIMGRAWGGGVGPVNPEDPWIKRYPISSPMEQRDERLFGWSGRTGPRDGMKYVMDWGDLVIDEDAYEDLAKKAESQGRTVKDFIEQLSVQVRKSVLLAPQGMFDTRTARTRPQVHITSGQVHENAAALNGSTLRNLIYLFTKTQASDGTVFTNSPADLLGTVPHEFGHLIHQRQNLNKTVLKKPGILIEALKRFNIFDIPFGATSSWKNLQREDILAGPAKGMPGNRSILDSIKAIGSGKGKSQTYFNPGPMSHYVKNLGETYANLYDDYVLSGGGVGKLEGGVVPSNYNEYLTRLGKSQGWTSFAGRSSGPQMGRLSKTPFKSPGYGLRPGNILYNPGAQAGVGSIIDMVQMAMTGTLSAAGAGASIGLNALSMIPKFGGPLAALAGLALTHATGGNTMRALFSTIGSIGGGLLGGFAGSFLAPGVGTVALGYGGSMAGGALGGSLYDLLFGGPGGSTVQGSFRKSAFDIPGKAWGGAVGPSGPEGANFTNFGDKGRTTGKMPAAFLDRFMKYGMQGLYNTPWEKYIGGSYMPVYGNAVNAWWDRLTVASSVPFSSLPKYQQLNEIMSGAYLPPEFYTGNKENLSYAELMASRGAKFPGVVQGWMTAFGEKPAVTYWDRGARENNPENAEYLKYNRLYNWWRKVGQFGNYKGYDDPYYRWTKTIDPKTGILTDTWPETALSRKSKRVQDLIPEISTWMLTHAGPMTQGWFGKEWTMDQYKSSPWGKKMFGPWKDIMFGEGGFVGDIEKYSQRVQQGWMGERYAAGGSYRQNRAFLVGENGPEIMVPGGLGGSIIPNHKLRGPGNIGSMASGQSVNASVIINNPTVSNSADIDKLAAKVSEAQTRALRAAGYVRPS
jgi:tape measure domain-containing protein